jgi:hypothetical protein
MGCHVRALVVAIALAAATGHAAAASSLDFSKENAALAAIGAPPPSLPPTPPGQHYCPPDPIAFDDACPNPNRGPLPKWVKAGVYKPAIEAIILSSLRDPESARFRWEPTVTAHPNSKIEVHVWVNAKNAFGGYAGRDLYAAELARKDGSVLFVLRFEGGVVDADHSENIYTADP